jgi:predicted tellurium resistance membrane protein TerC
VVLYIITIKIHYEMSAEILISLFTLIALEIVLGIDNVVFISILTDKLPPEQRKKARFIGLSCALIMRLILLAFISWILKLDKTLFEIAQNEFSGKVVILILGGLFLLYKASAEIFVRTEDQHHSAINVKNGLTAIIGQILLLDLVFSVDSIITAVGLVDELWIMYTAVIVSISITLLLSGKISSYINEHPSLKILAWCFLMVIGMALIADGFDFHIPKGYIYFSMAFSLFVNMVQISRQDKHPKIS